MARIHDIESPRNLAVQPLTAATFTATGRTLDTDTGPPRRVWARVWPREKLIDQIPINRSTTRRACRSTGWPRRRSPATATGESIRFRGRCRVGKGISTRWRYGPIFLGPLVLKGGRIFLRPRGRRRRPRAGRQRRHHARGSRGRTRHPAKRSQQRGRGCGRRRPRADFKSNSAKLPAEVSHPPTHDNAAVGKPVALAISGSASSSASQMPGINDRTPADSSPQLLRCGLQRQRQAAPPVVGGRCGSPHRLCHRHAFHLRAPAGLLGRPRFRHQLRRATARLSIPHPQRHQGGDMWGIGCFHESSPLRSARRRSDQQRLVERRPVSGTRRPSSDGRLHPGGWKESRSASDGNPQRPVDGRLVHAVRPPGSRSGGRPGTLCCRVRHGVDADAFHGVPRHQARRRLQMPLAKGDFVVSNINRNQPRKRLDLTIQYFADRVGGRGVADAYLYLHCSEHDVGWNVRQLAAYFGVGDRLLLPKWTTPSKGFRGG